MICDSDHCIKNFPFIPISSSELSPGVMQRLKCYHPTHLTTRGGKIHPPALLHGSVFRMYTEPPSSLSSTGTQTQSTSSCALSPEVSSPLQQTSEKLLPFQRHLHTHTSDTPTHTRESSPYTEIKPWNGCGPDNARYV